MLDSLVYSLVGEDTELFEFDTTTGEVSYQSWYTPSYSDVWDFNRDNIYEMSVIGLDDNGIEVTRTDLELVVSQTGAVWQNAGDSDPVDPVDPAGSLVYSLVGEDTVLFQVDAATGQVSYQSWYTPSYTDVWDFDRDNIYEMSVIGTDDNGIEVTRNDLELVVSQTGAVWRNAGGSDPVDPVDPVDPDDPAGLLV
jgi:hypothetical protein